MPAPRACSSEMMSSPLKPVSTRTESGPGKPSTRMSTIGIPCWLSRPSRRTSGSERNSDRDDQARHRFIRPPRAEGSSSAELGVPGLPEHVLLGEDVDGDESPAGGLLERLPPAAFVDFLSALHDLGGSHGAFRRSGKGGHRSLPEATLPIHL